MPNNMDRSEVEIREAVSLQLAPEDSSVRHEDAVKLLSSSKTNFSVCGKFPSYAPHFADHSYQGFCEEEIHNMLLQQSRSFYWRSRNDVISWLMQRFFKSPDRILDIGCGTGYVTQRLSTLYPSTKIYASDVFIKGLEMSRNRLGSSAFLLHLDATNLPFCEPFDVITSFDVLEHIPDDIAVLKQCYNSLRSGGGMLHFVPQHPFLYGPADVKAHHERRYARGELEKKIEGAGFKVIYSSSYIFLLSPVFFLSRFIAKLRGKYNLDSEHNSSAFINELLYFVQKIELNLQKTGMCFPCGVSRAVVARKI